MFLILIMNFTPPLSQNNIDIKPSINIKPTIDNNYEINNKPTINKKKKKKEFMEFPLLGECKCIDCEGETCGNYYCGACGSLKRYCGGC